MGLSGFIRSLTSGLLVIIQGGLKLSRAPTVTKNNTRSLGIIILVEGGMFSITDGVLIPTLKLTHQ